MTATITGDKELDKRLKHLADKGIKKVVRAAMNKQLAVLVRGIRAEVPVGENKALKKAIGKSFKKNKRAGIIEAKAGVNVAKKGNKAAPHGHLVALGTAERFHKSGKSVGKVEPNDFVKRGTQAALSESESAFKQEAMKKLEAEARKTS